MSGHWPRLPTPLAITSTEMTRAEVDWMPIRIFVRVDSGIVRTPADLYKLGVALHPVGRGEAVVAPHGPAEQPRGCGEERLAGCPPAPLTAPVLRPVLAARRLDQTPVP